MSQNRPDDDTLYQALLNRDPSFKDQVFVGVTTTGIYCQLTCPARKPKRAHCRFMDNRKDCESAGFRACKRCFREKH